MGYTCGTVCESDVKFQQIDMKISRKNCETLERYGQGAAARREANKIKQEHIREIASLKKPTYGHEGGKAVVYLNEDLIPEEQLKRYISMNGVNNGLKWINYF